MGGRVKPNRTRRAAPVTNGVKRAGKTAATARPVAAKRKSPAPPLEFELGQVWRMATSELHITDVGNLLVHYKLFQQGARRTVTTMSAKRVVENHLKENKAVLVRRTKTAAA